MITEADRTCALKRSSSDSILHEIHDVAAVFEASQQTARVSPIVFRAESETHVTGKLNVSNKPLSSIFKNDREALNAVQKSFYSVDADAEQS